MANNKPPKALGQRLANFRLKLHMTELHCSNERIRLSERENPELSDFLDKLETVCDEIDNLRITVDELVDRFYEELT